MNANERQRENGLRLVEDHIGRAISESEASGELRTAKGFGQPLEWGDGYWETPEALRMGFKILKDGGMVPPEVELMQQIDALRKAVDAEPDPALQAQGHARLTAMRQQLTIRLEQLRPLR